jgi:hypothetical protein
MLYCDLQHARDTAMRTERGIAWVLMCIRPSFSFEIIRIFPTGGFLSVASIRTSVFGLCRLTADV